MGAILNIFKYLGKGFILLEEAAICLLLVATTFLACTQIFLRDFFSTGFAWAEPLLRYMVLWLGLVGAAAATRKGRHIAIDVASHLIPEHLAPWLRLLLNLCSAAVCFILTYAAIIFVRNEAAFPSGHEVLSIPSWQLNLIFPLALGLIAGRFLIIAANDIAELIQQQRKSA